MRRTHTALLGSLLFASACSGGVTKPGSRRSESADSGASSPTPSSGPAADGATSPEATEGEGLDAGEPGTDTGEPGTDAGVPAVSCRDVTFRFESATATSVWVTGTFTHWAETPATGALMLVQHGNVWEGTTTLPNPGEYLYKLIIDGSTWMPDPANPRQIPDGFGGMNSGLDVCSARLEVVSQHTDPTMGVFEATLRLNGSDTSAAILTLDHARQPPSTMSANGDALKLRLSGLSPGIHDVRLEVGASRTLFKVYVGVSTDWKDSTIYFVMTDRFKNGDPSNDAPVPGVPIALNNYMGGDFAGVRQAIDSGYFDRLGVGALWLSWPVDNTDTAWSGPYSTYSGCQKTGYITTSFAAYHGYWPKSSRDIESHFGTMDELKALVDAAHAHGIRVLLDFAANHMHQDAAVFHDHPDWFNQPPTLCRDGHWEDELREECWFDSFLPDWNYSKPEARREVLDAAEWLGTEVGADGFRVDALKHMQNVFITELRSRMSAAFEHTGVRFYMVGETFTGDPNLIRTYVNPQMMDGQFDFPTNMAILQGFASDELGLDAMHAEVRRIKAGYGMAAPYMSTFVGNHDIARFVSKASGDLGCGIWAQGPDQWRAYDGPPGQPSSDAPYKRLQMALTYAYTVPGIPLLYYGDEVGLAGAGDPDNRRMLPEDRELDARQRAMREFAERLGRTRQEASVLRSGDWTDALAQDSSFLAFARTSPNAKAIVVLNRGGDRTVNIPVAAALGIPDGTVLTAKLHEGRVTVSGGQATVSIPGSSAEIFLTP